MSEASSLVYTSVEDMKSSLECAEDEGRPYSIATLKQALAMAMKLEEKTRVKLLEARIRKYEREGMKK